MKLIKPSFTILPHLEYPAMLRLVSRASSVCYRAEVPESWKEQEKLVATRIKAGHESVIEHVGFSVEFRVDRGITHELVRHRLAAFTQESTRFCDYDKDKFGGHLTYIMPPEISLVVPEGIYTGIVQVEAPVQGGVALFLTDEKQDAAVMLDSATHAEWASGLLRAEIAYRNAVQMGLAPEIARGVLPNALAAYITVTANMREWRHIFRLRALGTTGRPHPQMVEIMTPLLEEAMRRFPAFFTDL